MDGAVLSGMVIFEAVPVLCLGLVIVSFRIRRLWVKILIMLPSAFVLSGIVLLWWAMRGLAGIN